MIKPVVALFVFLMLQMSTAHAEDKNAPTSPAPQAEARTVAEEGSSSGNKFGIYLGSNIPYLFLGGVDYMWNSNYSFSVEAGSLGGTISDVKLALTKYEATARWHIFSSAFYAGLGVGQQSLSAESSVTEAGISATAKLEVKNSFVTPKIGWLWFWGSGFNVGLDFGYQMNSGAKTTVSSSTTDPAVLSNADYLAAEKNAKDAGDKFGSLSYITMTWLRIGYLF